MFEEISTFQPSTTENKRTIPTGLLPKIKLVYASPILIFTSYAQLFPTINIKLIKFHSLI